MKKTGVHVFVEGASTAKGYGDQEGRGGFVGRMSRYYEGPGGYNWESSQKSVDYVIVHPNGIPDNDLPTVAEFFGTNVQRVRTASRRFFPDASAAEMAIVTLSGAFHPNRVRDNGGPEAIQAAWVRAFGQLTTDCAQLGARPTLITTPAPSELSEFRDGAPPDFELHQNLMRIGRHAATTMGASFITFEDMTGGGGGFVDRDGLHPNAAGYEKMANYLINFVNAQYDIPASVHDFPLY